MSLRNPVVSVLAPSRAFALDVVDGTPFELLVALHALTSPDRGDTWAPRGIDECPPATRTALAALGDPAGELWLHLFGLALEAEADDAAAFVEHVARMAPLDVRRHALGLYAPGWSRMMGVDTIERAARGDARARERLASEALAYCAETGESLAAVLPLDPAETKARIVTVLDRFEREVFGPREHSLRLQLDADAEARRALIGTTDPYDLIESASGGYRYQHEPTFDRVLLVPHLADAPAILLCEHRTSYMIAYPAASAELDLERSLLAIGRALGDASRVAILARLRRGEANLAELADAAALAKSTTHHHLVQLRAAGLITVRGNTQGRTYALDPAGFSEAERLLAAYNPD